MNRKLIDALGVAINLTGAAAYDLLQQFRGAQGYPTPDPEAKRVLNARYADMCAAMSTLEHHREVLRGNALAGTPMGGGDG